MSLSLYFDCLHTTLPDTFVHTEKKMYKEEQCSDLLLLKKEKQIFLFARDEETETRVVKMYILVADCSSQGEHDK